MAAYGSADVDVMATRATRRGATYLVQGRFAFLGAGLGGLFKYYFFQAGDGIRGATVFGLQKCALPVDGVAGVPHRREEEPAELLLLPVGVEGCALGRAHL